MMSIPKRSILVVDDDSDIRTSLTGILEEEGYSTIAAANGREAIECMKVYLPGLILLDIMMPVMNGIQFRIEQMNNADWRSVPVIVMTAKSQNELLREGPEFQGISLMRKPFDLRTLLDLVARSV